MFPLVTSLGNNVKRGASVDTEFWKTQVSNYWNAIEAANSGTEPLNPAVGTNILASIDAPISVIGDDPSNFYIEYAASQKLGTDSMGISQFADMISMNSYSVFVTFEIPFGINSGSMRVADTGRVFTINSALEVRNPEGSILFAPAQNNTWYGFLLRAYNFSKNDKGETVRFGGEVQSSINGSSLQAFRIGGYEPDMMMNVRDIAIFPTHELSNETIASLEAFCAAKGYIF